MPASASGQLQRRGEAERYDETFRKYTKRYFGPGYDWRLFKAQGMAESNLDPDARSWVGAQGVMQLMPSTFKQIRSQQPDLRSIGDPEMNIGAGILYDRSLWNLWAADSVDVSRESFMFASYNAGRRTILNAQIVARRESLDVRNWQHITRVAPRVPRWRYTETLGYVARIDSNLTAMDDHGRLKADSVKRKGVRRR
ncbi:MAG: transglycosylase SLT domain-containing protein [Gemmatimonadaceae bacterium]